MLFIVQFEDIYATQPERLKDRAALMEAHLAFLASNARSVIASGALRESEEGVPQGGIWIVKAESKDEVARLAEEDPFFKAGLRQSVKISLWAKAFWSPAFSDCMASMGHP